ncbi:MAG: Arylesterase [Proteobacteria bacterium]|jgi:acyl-CoA thioesterase-1|nr:Arylesterase [Pseudomonadota bacterium]MBS1225126.1 Arylesterase [Pseudomonadota bacterium]MBS1247363.1 Arylesterase [Pseudomonadota bacterium]MCU0807613.1 arylesterase [Candidatus Contendobacter sp.]
MIKTNRSRWFSILLLWLVIWPGLARAEAPVILVFGDSLSAGYGLPAEQGWVSLLQRRLAERGFPHQIVNASISGDTTSGGLSRLPATLERHRPALVILELGANDGLRGQPPMAMANNLARMIELSQQSGARVLLAEMRIPPNYGPLYTQKFQATFGELAKRYDIPLIPFLLEGVAGNPALTQDDGLHPRAEGQPRVLDNVWPTLEPLLTR